MKISNNDKRSYETLTLDNGLKVLLVQDVNSNKSAASLTVNTGHFDDPKDRQGMAHFIEHMLFLGTQKFPEPGFFSQFISQAGGQSNAWTGTEHSSYYFDCDHQQFPQAIEIFSEFFISPLFHIEQATSERNAIDAEFKMKVKDDGRRIYQVHKETVNPEHPFAKFAVGNQQTLEDREKCIAEELHTFFKAHYLAQWMTLAIAGPQPIETLRELAIDCFSDIAATQSPKPTINTPLYRTCDLGKLIHITPKKQMQKLIVSFAMPNIPKLYKSKSLSFLAHLLGFEGEGSLYSILKAQGWINALSAGGGVNGSNFKDFNISFALTEQGIEFYEDIIEMLFEYISLIEQSFAQLPELYADKQALLEIAFDNQEPSKLIEWVNSISINMHHFDENDYLAGDYVMTGFEPQLHKKLCRYLSPKNMRVVLIHQGVETNKSAQWYNTAYLVEDLPSLWLETLAKTVAPLPQMMLPTVNPYLKAKQVLHDSAEIFSEPKKLEFNDGLNFWFKQDSEFKVTKGHLYIEIDSKVAVSSIKNMALTRLMADLLMDGLAEPFYSAELAGLNYHITSHQGGLTLHTAGLSANQPQFAVELLTNILSREISASRFAEYKKQLTRHWLQHNHNKPVSQLFSILGAHLMPWNPTPEDLALHLKPVTFNAFVQFRDTFFKAIHIKSFMYGNWLEVDAEKMLKDIKHTFKHSEILEDLKRPLTKLKHGFVHKLEKDKSEHGFLYYIQAKTADAEEKVQLMLLNQLVQQAYFDELRTKQQLGYLVGAGYAPFNTRAGVAFYIQSPNNKSDVLSERHSQFIDLFTEELTHLSNDAFLEAKHALKLQIAEKDKNLRLRAQRLWVAITNDDHYFSMQKRLLTALNLLSKDMFIKNATALISNQDSHARLSCN
ncbi:peptidase M16 [Pseudoalteromonas phenolica]|uniref:insulinase family protein n=1 Tax=Pseudoalteromonas phenolica TaxID=161398 RepID=UPI00110AA19F|nr:insulinase family protein [Pseudoalteromonas phenolica]TMN86584.1 peptidase M16 [Pseudoalteromonas phenolica]